MSDKRIHQHNWENGRCKVCGVSEHPAESESPKEPMSKRELGERLDRIEKRISTVELSINTGILVFGILLIVFMLRGH